MREKILRTEEVCNRLGVSQTTFWRWRKTGFFPQARVIPGSSMRGWPESVIEHWILQKFGSKTELK